MKDLNNFLNEKKDEKKKPHATKKDEGADDKKYIKMMEQYKRLRRTDTEKANELLEKIFELGRKGDVSKNAKIAGAYI
jgi:hypothetical protein